MEQIKVDLQERSYPIYLGENIIPKLARDLATKYEGRQIIIVSNDEIFTYYGKELLDELTSCDIITEIIPTGEEYKTFHMAEQILSKMIRARFNRDALLIALGGGVVGDLAGFVASIYQRGIDFIQIPTTLLATVDSSVGGKVAVNHTLGKNLIGSFYQPKEVWIDVKVLHTLPEREWKAGLAEVIKYGVIWDKELYEFLEENSTDLTKDNLNLAQKIISRSCRIKAEVVSKDEREENLRAILNFGHTFGHALESATGYNYYRHGEAVAIGMVMAGKLALEIGMWNINEYQKLKNLLVKVGLPIDFPSEISREQIYTNLFLDKKIKDKKLIFILPQSLGQVEIVKNVNIEIVKELIQKFRA
ncbi:3-dehydroquinate synthase [Desulfonispora thiosulfatigenes DSM 11270]|uniref:3-dehydroquinate synthase n=1 Tax=Desulfonispora thiosulfatigenes DSM 11270 TaxID=656914 RepID=A0A1W1V7I4_DESTI|nr:3-dehydroquinate synthase [Desulfonispora thiosulfatigenes]SMB89243.1 3-dehydroquinate synthase [Desulfonispora thiosulfatigenes DSM 11270]